MSSGDGQRPVSTSDSLNEWLGRNERYEQQRDLSEATRAARHANTVRLRTSATLRTIVRDHPVLEFQRSGERVREVIDTLAALLAIHEEKLAELQHLTAQAEAAELLLRDSIDREGSKDTGPLREQVRAERDHSRGRMLVLVEDLTALETEVAGALESSKTLERIRNIVAEYENDGLVPDPPAQLRGNLKRRMQQCVYDAFDWAIVVVEEVYNDSALLELESRDFATELRRRFSESHLPILTVAAMAIEQVRRRRDPDERQYDQAASEERLLRQLRDEHFVGYLRPLGRSGGEGSGARMACFRLIAAITKLSWTTVRDYVAHCENKRDKRFSPPIPRGETDAAAARGTLNIDWEAMSMREHLKVMAEAEAEVVRRINSPATPPEQLDQLRALADLYKVRR